MQTDAVLDRLKRSVSRVNNRGNTKILLEKGPQNEELLVMFNIKFSLQFFSVLDMMNIVVYALFFR